MTVLAVSAVGPEKSVENENCNAPFCSCDETLNLWPGREMAFTSAEAESDEVIKCIGCMLLCVLTISILERVE